MTHATPLSALPSEFDTFLFEPIREESNGMLLSVLSALARLDIDPWQEASNLALLPTEAATKRLASMIAVPPNGVPAHPDSRKIAAHLIALLPGRTSSPIASRATSLGIAGITRSNAFLYALFFLMAVIVVAQFLAAGR